MRTFYLCGRCAEKFIATGASQREARIYPGTTCEAHPSGLAVQAVAVVEAEAAPELAPERSSETLLGVRADPDTVPSVPSPIVAVAAAGGLPPETEIAARLLVAWTGKSEGGKADDLMVRHAAEVARRLLVETGGR